MRWSGAGARGLQHPTTVMIANNCELVSEVKLSTGPATAATVLKSEMFFGIDAAKVRHVVTRLVAAISLNNCLMGVKFPG